MAMSVLFKTKLRTKNKKGSKESKKIMKCLFPSLMLSS